ncbi:hypothetical protein EHP00_241 [Ecytonucleospora hepatopenaei]|uniref:Transcription factor CBF/NF-Y/archaeal histone domain-containing protein n=1 Tax=Ecytonucleospora hepatopenaei TaxID=646526 RepID=A0A1W0E6I9_9MICR|nr:hypothetical protein EHP00_241 [Ecytonucleospora hepatopenaei]
MVVLCKTLLRETQNIAKSINLEINDEMMEYLIECTQNTLVNVLQDAETVAHSQKRKTVNAADVLKVVEQRKLPFYCFTQ